METSRDVSGIASCSVAQPSYHEDLILLLFCSCKYLTAHAE